MSSFFQTAISNLRTSGTIAPSSQWLVRKCLAAIDFSRDLTIIEFGMGDGVITEQILKNMSPDSRLITFEINETFLKDGEAKFADETRLDIVDASAFDFPSYLAEKGIPSLDYIVSSLPLTFFTNEETEEFLKDCYQNLESGGAYIQYQYTLGKYRLFRRVFDRVVVDYTFRNLPPAFIFTCLRS